MSVSAVTAPAFMTTNDLTESASIVQTIEANAAGTYNSTNAVNYAKKYWNNYNPNYRNFNSVGGDCANFVSQCLKAGGLKTDGTWNCYSLAWVNCQAQLNYLKSQGYKATDWAKASDLQVGDVVYYYNGSTICHTAICTKVANGQAYVTAHNKNHVDYEWTLGGSNIYKLMRSLTVTKFQYMQLLIFLHQKMEDIFMVTVICFTFTRLAKIKLENGSLTFRIQ